MPLPLFEPKALWLYISVKFSLMVDDYIFSFSWDEFENWIKQQIDGDFSWKLRPIDSKDNREAVAESILIAIIGGVVAGVLIFLGLFYLFDSPRYYNEYYDKSHDNNFHLCYLCSERTHLLSDRTGASRLPFSPFQRGKGGHYCLR